MDTVVVVPIVIAIVLGILALYFFIGFVTCALNKTNSLRSEEMFSLFLNSLLC